MPQRTKEYLAKLVQKIQEYQLDQLLSEREVSEKAGLSYTMVSKIKKGKTKPTMATLRKLRDIGVDIPKLNKESFELIVEKQEDLKK